MGDPIPPSKQNNPTQFPRLPSYLIKHVGLQDNLVYLQRNKSLEGRVSDLEFEVLNTFETPNSNSHLKQNIITFSYREKIEGMQYNDEFNYITSEFEKELVVRLNNSRFYWDFYRVPFDTHNTPHNPLDIVRETLRPVLENYPIQFMTDDHSMDLFNDEFCFQKDGSFIYSVRPRQPDYGSLYVDGHALEMITLRFDPNEPNAYEYMISVNRTMPLIDGVTPIRVLQNGSIESNILGKIAFAEDCPDVFVAAAQFFDDVQDIFEYDIIQKGELSNISAAAVEAMAAYRPYGLPCIPEQQENTPLDDYFDNDSTIGRVKKSQYDGFGTQADMIDAITTDHKQAMQKTITASTIVQQPNGRS